MGDAAERESDFGTCIDSSSLIELKRMEAALRESEARFQQVVENIEQVFWVREVDPPRLVYVSPAWERVWHRSRAELAEDPLFWTSALHPEDQEWVREALERWLTQLDPPVLEVEYRLMLPSGEVHWVHDRGVLISGPDGEIRRAGGIAEDITPRKQADEALRESEERFRLATEAQTGVLYDWEPRLGRVRRSQGMYELLGFRPEEAPETSAWWWARIHPEDLTACQMQIEMAWRTRAPVVDVEYRVQHRDGRYLWVWDRARMVYDALGEPKRIVGCTISIDTRKRAEAALRRREQEFRALVENSPDSVVRFDRAGRHVYLNRAAAQAMGREASDALNKTFRQIGMPEELAEKVEIAHRAVYETGEEHTIEIALPGPSGERIFETRHVPELAHDGTVETILAIGRDITSHRQAERSLRESEEALKEADRRKDEFLATLAHELRNPLAPIHNAIAILRMKDGPDPETRWARDVIDRQGQHLTRLVDDLLDISRITRGKIELRMERIPLALVIERALETSRPLLENGRHALHLHVPDEPMFVKVDVTRIAQVLSNLLNNAAKYTPEGGRIELSVGVQDFQAVVSVRDNGIGIPPEMLGQIFDLFQQVESSLDRSQGGLGIGLTLARQLIEMHGGTIEARSAGLGKGSEFRFRLPIAQSPASERSAAAPNDMPALEASLRVLVVDDNQDSAETLARVLVLQGAECRTAHDGPQGIEVAEAFRPDLVLLDIGMPGMNGYEVARRLRASPITQDAVLVAMTGWGQEEDRARSEQAGFHRHLVKPVDLPTLKALLAAIAARNVSSGAVH